MTGCINTLSSAPTAAPPDAQSSSGSSNPLVLAVGDEKVFSGVTVRLVGVADDSRCPIDVTCVWAGDATVRLEARTERIAATPVVLHTAPELGQTAPFDRFTVTLLRLTPNRVSGRTIASDEYRVEVSLSEARQ